MTTASITLDGRCIGAGGPAFVIAEIGANHNGDPSLARELVHAASETGVDAVKFQLYTSEELLADRDRQITWGPQNASKTEPIGEMFDRIALPRDAFADLFAYARKLGLTPFATPFSIEGIKFLADLGAPCFKVASSDVTYLDFLDELARTGKPILLSVGKSTLGELDSAVRKVLDAQPAPSLAVLHCVASYPAPWHELNLRFIPTLATLYPQCVIGFSDHSLGTTAAIAAVTLGARIIEKHFTLDQGMDGPDHWFSSDPSEMKHLVKEIRNVEAAMGSSGKGVTSSEQAERVTSTRSLVLRWPVKAGTILSESHLKVVRPGWGIHPHDKDKVLGLRIACDLDQDTVLQWSHFKESPGQDDE